ELRDAVRRAGTPALVDHAARAWQAAKTHPYSAKYFLRGWTGLQAPTTYTGPRPVTPPSAASNHVAQMAATAAELRHEDTAWSAPKSPRPSHRSPSPTPASAAKTPSRCAHRSTCGPASSPPSPPTSP